MAAQLLLPGWLGREILILSAKCFLSTLVDTAHRSSANVLLSSGSNRLDDGVSSGHLPVAEKSHVASGLGDSISQSVAAHSRPLSQCPHFQATLALLDNFMF